MVASENDSFHKIDMRKGVAVWPLTTEIMMDCGNVMLAPLNFSLIRFLKFKYYGTFTNITSSFQSNAQLNNKGYFQ